MSATDATQKTALKPAIAPQGKEKPVSAKATPAKTKPAAAKPKAAAPVTKPVARQTAKPVAKPATVKPLPVKAKPAASGKNAAAAKPAQAAKTQAKPAAAVPAEKEKAKKIKLVRDSFTMPEAEYEVLGQVKKTCLKAGVEIKKSELLRIGVALIRRLDVASLKGVLATLPQLKSGRPVKEK
jgi:hypothetical protein